MADYSRDVTVSETWERLSHVKNSVLVDVRSVPEWNFVGIPDLSSLGKEPIFLEWQSYPTMQVVSDFSDRLVKAIEEVGGDQTTEVYFLCRSGVRSQGAASALTEAGYANCFNVVGGFEGPHDAERHRGQVDGWKALNLPWVQN